MARILYFIIFLGAAFLESRSVVAYEACPSGHFQVRWTSPPSTRKPDDVLDEMRKLTLAKEEAEQLQIWKEGRPDNRGPGVLSCADYVLENQTALSVDSLGEWNWHGATWKSSQFLKDCLAMYLVSTAKPARYDCLAGFQLNPSAARVLPSTLGLIISSIDQRGMSEAKSLPSWAPTMKFSLENSDDLVGKQEGDKFQEDHFTSIAFGDFDGDGYQDLLLAIRNISGGTYGELRIAVLSRKTQSGMLSHVFTAKNK
jgi:FG-GAP repeat